MRVSNTIGLAAAFAMVTPAVAAQSLPDFSPSKELWRNELVKVMTGVDPLNQPTITLPPAGADGWLQVGPDNMARFDGDGTSRPVRVYDDMAGATYPLSEHAAGSDLFTNFTDESGNTHQPYVITLQQGRDFGRCVEPVAVHFVTTGQPSDNMMQGRLYVQSMRREPDRAAVGCATDVVMPNIHADRFLIHHTRTQDDLINGSWSNNLKRNEAFSAMATATACDLDGDGYDDILVFVADRLYVFDGLTYEPRTRATLDVPTGALDTKLSYGHNTLRYGFTPNTWTSVTADFDGDGTPDVLAICHTGLYWDHLMSYLSGIDCESTTQPVYSVFIPGGKAADLTDLSSLVCKQMGRTPVLPFGARYKADIKTTKVGPKWYADSENASDGVANIDMYHYYYVAPTAEVIYPKDEYNSEQPVLVLGWKYMWSFRPTQDDAAKFRYGLTEWYQLTSYNITDNRGAFTTAGGGQPSEAARADMYDLLSETDGWSDADYDTYRNESWYYHTANTRASLGAPALKAWYANGRLQSPLLYFAGMTLWYRPDASLKFEVHSLDPLGQDTGWAPATADAAKASAKRGRVTGRPCTMLVTNDATADDALTDMETLIVPAVACSPAWNDDSRYCDSAYYLLSGAPDPTATDTPVITPQRTTLCSDVPSKGYNSPFQPVPYTVHKAHVELQRSYYTASNPMVKAVLAIPPYNASAVGTSDKGSVAFSRSADHTTDQSTTSSNTVGGGFSMSMNLFSAFKMSFSRSYQHEWRESWANKYTVSQATEYKSSQPKNMVLFNYIPVDCFEYKVIDAPFDAGLNDETFTFRRALNQLAGESANIPEVWWTVDEYNEYVSQAGLPYIDKRIFPHTVGVTDSYRRVPRFATSEQVIANFPYTSGGFYAVHSESTAGMGTVSQKLGISQGKGHTQGQSESMSQDLGFSVSSKGGVFACGANEKYGHSSGWSVTTAWGEGMQVTGTVPALLSAADNYTFRQVWYEYDDADSGQNFLVCDWAIASNETRPTYASLNLVYIDHIDDDADQATYFGSRLEWNVTSEENVRCVLEYKVDGYTPVRNYDEYLTGSCTLPEDGGDWTVLDKDIDLEGEHIDWATVDYSADTAVDGYYHIWAFSDYFSLLAEQMRAMRDAVGYFNDVMVHYRVKVYRKTDAASAAHRAPSEADLLYTTNVVTTKLLDSGYTTGLAAPTFAVDPDAAPVYYNLQGQRVNNPTNGVYIKVQGRSATKVAL